MNRKIVAKEIYRIAKMLMAFDAKNPTLFYSKRNESFSFFAVITKDTLSKYESFIKALETTKRDMEKMSKQFQSMMRSEGYEINMNNDFNIMPIGESLRLEKGMILKKGDLNLKTLDGICKKIGVKVIY